MIFNRDMQLQIDYIEWVLQKIEINKIPNDRLEALFKKIIKDNATRRLDTDGWTKIETVWLLVLYP